MVDKTEAIELAGRQARDPHGDRVRFGRAFRSIGGLRHPEHSLSRLIPPRAAFRHSPSSESATTLCYITGLYQFSADFWAMRVKTLVRNELYYRQTKSISACWPCGHRRWDGCFLVLSASSAAILHNNGGEGWIRTSVRLRGQIYSLLPLTTRPPLQVTGRRAMWRRRHACVNARASERAAPVAPRCSLGRSNLDMPPACSRCWSG